VLITTEGFEDVLAIGRQDRPRLYDLEVERPRPPIPAGRRLGLVERVGPEGERERAVEEGSGALEELVERLRALDPPPEAIAVCLLHSYAEPAHEEAVGAAMRKAFPEVPLTLSSRLIPVFREYERSSTVAVNAAVQPVMGRYLERLGAGTAPARLLITASSGGTLSAGRAAAEPVHTLLSGPAAGVAGALAAARRAGFERVLTFDMGGTSTDVALCDGSIRQTAEGVVGGYPVQVPQVDLHTVGAGGGSLARVDRGGALVVGPESAGADPGPLAYGRREPGPEGEGVTVTDANLLLGRLPSGGLLGGGMTLDEAAAHRGLEALAAAASRTPGAGGMGPEAAAEGLVRVAVTAMAGALRTISVERGKDPRDYVLAAFGGAGAMHAAALARELGMERVLVPREPGLLSAVGTLTAGLRIDRARTVLGRGPSGDPAALLAAWEELTGEVSGALEDAGADPGEVRVLWKADLRYKGQSFELTVDAPRPTGGDAEEVREVVRRRFAEAHRERYGYRREGVPVELVSLRVEGHGPAAAELDDLLPLPEGPWTVGPESTLPGALSDFPRRPMVWEGERHPAPQVPRSELAPGVRLPGPVLIHEFSSTVIVPPDAEAEVGAYGDIVLYV
ncbi:MAG: hydantoinase/oxoprolinase family protein, partial [bacterium]